MYPLTYILLTLCVVTAQGFIPTNSRIQLSSRHFDGPLTALASNGKGSQSSNIPKSPAERDQQAIQAVQVAIKNPKTPSLPLIECEFPPLAALNKLGDGSLRSANLVDDANLAFGAKLVKALSPILFGPKVWFFTSSTSSINFMDKARKTIQGAQAIASLRDGIPEGIGKGDICVVMAPSVRQDYAMARDLATRNPVVLVNGMAKDQKSVGGDATMAYFLKPLTYNSQVVGYLVRNYPRDWTTIDVVTKAVLATYKDSDILFGNTNTPDLRDPGRRVQKSVDDRAIRARQS